MERKYALDTVEQRLHCFLSALLAKARLKLQYQISEAETGAEDFETPDIKVTFDGPDVELLLENKAELLLALEHVAVEMLRMPPEDHSRLCFDAHDYRKLRIEELRLAAAAAADRVKRTGQPFFFSPMNSRERRIIHLALNRETAVRSESGGMGPGRMVVVYPAGMPSLAPEALPAPPVHRPAERGGGGRDRGPRRRRG